MKVHELERPALSNAVHVTLVVPCENGTRLDGEQDAFLIPDPSIAVGVISYAVTIVSVFKGSCKLRLAGHTNVGGVVSLTTTLNVGQEATLPALSVAEHTTGVLPRSKEVLEPGLHSIEEMPLPSTAENVHVGVAVGDMPFVGVNDSEFIAEYGGHVNVGGVESTFAIENEQFDVRLA